MKPRHPFFLTPQFDRISQPPALSATPSAISTTSPPAPQPVTETLSATPSAPTISSTSLPSRPRCSWTSTDGRQCRMFRHADHPDFCTHHAEQELKALGDISVTPLAAELLGPIQDFRTGTAVNAALGNLWIQLADGRIDTRRASVLAYIGRQLQQGLKRVALEESWRDPSPSLQAALSAILRAPKLKSRSAKPIKNPR